MHNDREGLYLISGSILGILLLSFGFGGQRSFEEAALGTMTVSHHASAADGTCIHTERTKPEETAEMLQFSAHHPWHVLVLGNSQTHSINQKEAGQTVYPAILNETLGDSTAVITHSMPNANFQEFRVAHSWWSEQEDWEVVLVPAFMDDLREDGLRGDFLKAPVTDGHQLHAETALAIALNNQLALLTNPPSESGSESKEETPQDIVERELNNWLSDNTDTWKNRANARGDIFLSLYGLRNKAFGITASTQRKMIPARYDRNMLALEELLEHATALGQEVLLYIPPIRTDVAPPYDADEYARFKASIEAMAAEHGVRFANLENLIPGEYWGLKASTDGDGEPELDYMHFQYKGHQMLAEALKTEIEQR